MAGEAREKCAVSGVVMQDPLLDASPLVYETLFAMQHRGVEACGITSQDAEGDITYVRERGLVRDVFTPEVMNTLLGSMAVGHNRYSTSGSKVDHPQPFIDKWLAMSIAMNGNLPLVDYLQTRLSAQNIKTSKANDTELMGLSIAQHMRNGLALPSAIELTYPLLRGAFSCVAIHDDTMVAFRDNKGIRPLALGSTENGVVIASETCGLDIVGAKYEREIRPGEMLIVAKNGEMYSRQIAEGEEKLDMFEFVYFARHDSYLYGKSVNEVRRNFGKELAKQHPPITNKTKNILVVPVPDTSVPAAEGYAKKLGLEQRQAIIKNRFIGRTFMLPNQAQRKDQLRRKHNIIPEAIKGRDLVLIDDSIVRLNTMPKLVQLAKSCGAKTVSVLIASPPVRFPDYYGIDTPAQKELAAANLTIEQMRKKIKCDYLGFLSLSGTVNATGLTADKFNLSCFNGEYPIGIGARKKEIFTPVSMEGIE